MQIDHTYDCETNIGTYGTDTMPALVRTAPGRRDAATKSAVPCTSDDMEFAILQANIEGRWFTISCEPAVAYFQATIPHMVPVLAALHGKGAITPLEEVSKGAASYLTNSKGRRICYVSAFKTVDGVAVPEFNRATADLFRIFIVTPEGLRETDTLATRILEHERTSVLLKLQEYLPETEQHLKYRDPQEDAPINLDDLRLAAAMNALSNYDFDSEFNATFAESSGFEWTSPGDEMSCAVYLDIGTDSTKKVTLTVRFNPKTDEIIEVSAG